MSQLTLKVTKSDKERQKLSHSAAHGDLLMASLYILNAKCV